MPFIEKAKEAHETFVAKIHGDRSVFKPLSVNTPSPSQTPISYRNLPWWQRPDVYLRAGKDEKLGHHGGAQIDFGSPEEDKKPAAKAKGKKTEKRDV